jgi:hypothetical protein
MKHKTLASYILQRNNTHKPMSCYYKKTHVPSPLRNQVIFKKDFYTLNQFLLYKKKIARLSSENF